MSAQAARSEALDDIYAVLRTAAAQKRSVAAIYDGLPRLFCPHVLGKNRQGELRAFCYQFGGESDSGLRTTPEGPGGWRCIAVDKLHQVELWAGAWRSEPRAGRQHCIEYVDFDAEVQPGGDPQNGQ